MTDTSRPVFSDEQLLYSAVSCCRCGAGLAYPLDHGASMQIRAWLCSRVLKGEVMEPARRQMPMGLEDPGEGEHDAFDWAFYKVREETSINNAGGRSTRPPGTVARTVGRAKCPKCSRQWQSEPYDAATVGHHWRCGPCPQCGYAVGGDGVYGSEDGPPIDQRFSDVVIASAALP